ncbi:MAG: hypothetical protein JNN07_00450 [Verrucomicrobiales bacterium]|nr:hypothetical protein [Verrucomicrobiales bacterium]
MKLDHPALVRLLQRAYSGEKAAAFAYIGHARSLRDPAAQAAVRQIELDEWKHRENVLELMRRYEVPVSRWLEVRLHIIGRVISASCHVIGRFMPFFFAGKLESGNVCEYFVMMRHFNSLGIHDHDDMLYEMGMKEKEHEIYFLDQIRKSGLLPLFERLFSWGERRSANDVDLDKKLPVSESGHYCRTYKARKHTQGTAFSRKKQKKTKEEDNGTNH